MAVVSVTETKKAVLGTRLRDALPLIGLSVAVIVNAAWISLVTSFSGSFREMGCRFSNLGRCHRIWRLRKR